MAKARRVKLHITAEEVDGSRGIVTFDDPQEAVDWLEAFFPPDYRRDEFSEENHDDLEALIDEARLGFGDWHQRADGRMQWPDGEIRLDWSVEEYEPTAQEVLAALDSINRARSSSGLPALDATGWAPADLIAEAKRLGHDPEANPRPYPKRPRPVTEQQARKRAQTQARLLAFLLEHGRSRVRGGHVSLARLLARRGLVTLIHLRPGYAVEIAPGKEAEAQAFVDEHGVPDDPEQRRKRKLLAW